ncbi:MAG: hypothetical protein JWL77_1875 [Chthonomonadaceae bacterium]|jgi:hypothetical protein|nr:hypothetical protein [Chthonomonadaceae bacterium]
MKRFTSRVFAGLSLVCILISVTGITGCSKKEEPVPNADPTNNKDEGKGAMPGSGSDKK